MVQNLKVDIIYHQTPSDFEMEFNLCGCCRMRLLSDKTSDKKGFVKALARNVSRSRVIIGCGPLFGEEGIIRLVSKAIGNGLAVCDNKTYGINGNDQIHIINGSTPLVTPDGYFGGCIIESGPQTIILLTENKTFRKTIMQNLIHPYIEEISYIPTKTDPIITHATQKNDVVNLDTDIMNDENFLTDVEDYEENIVEPTPMLETEQSDHNIEFVMDGESDAQAQEEIETLEITANETAQNASCVEFVMDVEETSDENQAESVVSETPDEYNLMFTEVDKTKSKNPHYDESYNPSESDNLFLITPDINKEELKRKEQNASNALNITIVILVLFLLLAILALVYLIVLRPITMGIGIGDYINEIFGLNSGSTLV